MRQKLFINEANLNVQKWLRELRILNVISRCRLRGAWGYAQDTVPKWACFSSKFKELRISSSVDPLSTVFEIQKNLNKFNARSV